jgi:hypothetical protein
MRYKVLFNDERPDRVIEADDVDTYGGRFISFSRRFGRDSEVALLLSVEGISEVALLGADDVDTYSDAPNPLYRKYGRTTT